VIYVADTGSNAIREIATPSDVVTTLAGQITNNGGTDGQGAAARFFFPSGVAYYNGSLYVADPGNDVIRHVDLSTNMVTTYAGQDGVIDSLDGTTTAAFGNPAAVAVDAGGNVYVADSTEYNIRMIVPATANTPVTVSTLAALPAAPARRTIPARPPCSPCPSAWLSPGTPRLEGRERTYISLTAPIISSGGWS